MKSHWIKYKDHDIFYTDYTSLDADGLRAEAAAVVVEIKRHPLDSVDVLSDARGTIVSPVVLDIYKQVAQQTSKYVRRLALLGLKEHQRFFLNLIVQLSGMKIRAFEDEARAKEWLVSKSK